MAACYEVINCLQTVPVETASGPGAILLAGKRYHFQTYEIPKYPTGNQIAVMMPLPHSEIMLAELIYLWLIKHESYS